ncbi:prepilin-type N-terminal cleavage/methylation domain-containing protein [Patescibacteria group bacterium]|nr:prepilin-type N-terminal cleavage/methylation domain-containing protein [Patescibacteria group bacterium]
MKERGFTIPELLVSLLAFSLVIGGATNLLLTGIIAQRHSLATEELLDQTSFLAEYMTRVLRQAQKDLGPTCLSTSGLNYELTLGGQGVKFLNNAGQCHEFLLQGTRIQESIPPAPAEFLTSDNLEVVSLQFVLLGENQTDDLQPRVTFGMVIQGQGPKPESKPSIQLHTTVSQRKVDVPN